MCIDMYVCCCTINGFWKHVCSVFIMHDVIIIVTAITIGYYRDLSDIHSIVIHIHVIFFLGYTLENINNVLVYIPPAALGIS